MGRIIIFDGAPGVKPAATPCWGRSQAPASSLDAPRANVAACVGATVSDSRLGRAGRHHSTKQTPYQLAHHLASAKNPLKSGIYGACMRRHRRVCGVRSGKNAGGRKKRPVFVGQILADVPKGGSRRRQKNAASRLRTARCATARGFRKDPRAPAPSCRRGGRS